jgi:hypothetical protein
MLLTASHIIQQSWQVFTRNWKKFLPYCVVLGLIMFLSSLTTLLQPIEYKYGLITDNGIVLFVGVILFVIITTLLTMMISIAFSFAIKDALDNQPIRDFKTTFKQTKSFILPVLLVSILTGLFIMVGTIAVIIPGIIFAVWYVFSTYEVIFNNKRGLAAMKSSKALVLGRWWRVLWRILIPSLVYGIGIWIILMVTLLPLNLHYISKVDTTTIQARVNYLIIQGEGDVSKLSSAQQKSYLLNYHPEALLPLPVLVLNNLISSLVYMIFIPLSYCAFIILYFDVKKRTCSNRPQSL